VWAQPVQQAAGLSGAYNAVGCGGQVGGAVTGESDAPTVDADRRISEQV